MDKRLEDILRKGRFRRSDVALALFPDARHPRMALQYLMQGRRELKESEAQILERMADARSGASLTLTVTDNRVCISHRGYRTIAELGETEQSVTLRTVDRTNQTRDCRSYAYLSFFGLLGELEQIVKHIEKNVAKP